MIDLITMATAKDEADRDASVALLPVGSFEQHGDYLPLATDTIVACVIAQELARTYSVMVLPPITISCSHEHAVNPPIRRWQCERAISVERPSGPVPKPVIYYVTAGPMSLDCETRVFTWSRVSGLNVLAGVGAQLADLADHAAGAWRNGPGVIAPVT